MDLKAIKLKVEINGLMNRSEALSLIGEIERLTRQLERAEEALNLVVDCCTTRGHARFPLEIAREYFSSKD